MKWMAWGPDDLAAALPDTVDEIAKMIQEESDRLP